MRYTLSSKGHYCERDASSSYNPRLNRYERTLNSCSWLLELFRYHGIPSHSSKKKWELLSSAQKNKHLGPSIKPTGIPLFYCTQKQNQLPPSPRSSVVLSKKSVTLPNLKVNGPGRNFWCPLNLSKYKFNISIKAEMGLWKRTTPLGAMTCFALIICISGDTAEPSGLHGIYGTPRGRWRKWWKYNKESP